MLVRMNRKVFESLDDVDLGWACMATIMQPLRGKDPEAKLRVYSELTESQQVLFLFYAYYNHAKNSLDEFYWWSAHYFAQPKMWSEMKMRLRDLEYIDFVRLLEQIDDVLLQKEEPAPSFEADEVSVNDLQRDQVLAESMRQLYAAFGEVTPMALNKIGAYIRNNPDAFVQLEE